MRRFLTLLVLAVAACTPGGLRAFTTISGSPVWPDGTIVMHLQLGTGPVLADGRTWNTAAADTLAEWNRSLVRTRFTWVADSTVPIGDGNGVNNVVFRGDIFGRAFGDSTLAVTTVWRVGTRRTEADVVFNTRYTWESYRGPLKSTGGTGAEFSRVALHEFGHVLGLGHPDEAGQFVSAVMNSRSGDVDALTADDRDGAAFLYASNEGAVAPRITLALVDQNPVEGDAVDFAVGVSGTAPFTYQWRRNGLVQGVSTAAWTLSNVAVVSSGAWSVTVTNSRGSVTSTMNLNVTARPVAPAITRQPAAVEARPGQTVAFTVTATGSTPRLYEWRRNGVPLGPATYSDTLTLTEVQSGDAGTYSVEVSNSGGRAASAGALLTVTARTAPVFSAAPRSQSVSPGSTVVFQAAAAGDPAPNFQWRRDGVPLSGATSALLVLRGVGSADVGSYACVATNAVGAVSSTPATLTLSASADAGRLINLSILTALDAEDPEFTVGTVIGGDRTVGDKPLLVRAIGPGLAQFGIPLAQTLADPRLELIAGTTLASNDDWSAVAGDTFGRVGAFALANGSRDAALFQPALARGAYTVRVGGAAPTLGSVLAEMFDATPSSATGPASPRLINVSVRKRVAAGDLLTAGFVLGGVTARSVLVRVMGPSLTQFGLAAGDVMADPRLELFSAGTRIAGNDDWGGDPQLAAVGSGVGAFAPRGPTTTDAILLLTLAPGNYTAQATGGAGAGQVLVEVYEVP
ncbi:MAG: immunoglobulin domain-containing protein [Opitutaceae bacterium]